MGDMFDIGGVLNAYTAGRAARTQQMLLQRQIKREDKQQERDDALRALAAKLYAGKTGQQPKGGDQASSGGITAPYTPPAETQATLPASGAQISLPNTQPAGPQIIPTPDGHPDFELHSQAPDTFTQGADQETLAQIAAIGTPEAYSFIEHYNKLDEQGRKQTEDRVKMIGQAALYADTPEKWDSSVNWMVNNGHPEMSRYLGKFNPKDRMAAIATAGLLEKYTKANADRYMPVPGVGLFSVPAPGVPGDPERVGQPIGNGPPPGAIAELKANPKSAAQFDEIFGAGSSEKILGGSGSGQNYFPVSNGRAVIEDIFPGVHVTDNTRDPSSALGRANPDSWHNRSGGAVDVRPIPGMTFDQFVGRIRQSGYSIIEQRDEVKNPSRHATGPHWHVVLGAGR
jgi:hypothetical protein